MNDRTRAARRLRAAALVLVVLGAACAAALYAIHSRASREPDWWSSVVQIQEHENADSAARSLEAFSTTQLSAPRLADAYWTIELPEAHINAWLGTRLKAWLLNERGAAWPPEIERVAVRVADGALTIAIRTPIAGASRITWFTLEPSQDVMSERLLEITRGGVNDLAVPLPVLLTAVPQSVLDRIEEVLRDPVLPIDSGRAVEIRAVELREGTLVLTCSTVNT